MVNVYNDLVELELELNDFELTSPILMLKRAIWRALWSIEQKICQEEINALVQIVRNDYDNLNL